MAEEFVTYKAALAMQELGYKGKECFTFYEPKRAPFFKSPIQWIKDANVPYIKAPLYQQAFRWFREEHGLIGHLDYGSEFLPIWKINGYRMDSGWKNTHEGALDACIERLIEIVNEGDG